MDPQVEAPASAVTEQIAHHYEVEVKSLLGSEDKVKALKLAMLKVDPGTKLFSTSKQLNHYFEGGNLEALAESVAYRCLSEEKCLNFVDVAKKAKTFSVRTRQKDGAVFFVVKASVDDGTSENGVSRIEFEENVTIPLDALDSLILGSGFTYQAKWSREREEYSCKGVTVCIDKNAGYGYLAEFERVVDHPSKIPTARDEVRALMHELDVEELPQDRLERMFKFYNAHWEEYYGTDKTFSID
ncbi:MAG: CYTH domain-containing protein [Minisyncoccia bacterium]